MKKTWNSVRAALAIMFGITMCAAFLLKMVSVELFGALAGMVMAHYFDKKRAELEANGNGNGGEALK